MTDWRSIAPLPLRLFVGGGLVVHGGIKLFAPGGHDNIAHLVGELGVPLRDAVGWAVGAVEFGGGAAILVGAWFTVATIGNLLNVSGLLILGYLAGGIPSPLPGGDPLPQFREALLLFAGLASLLLSGPGRLVIADLMRRPSQGRRIDR